MRLNQLPFPVRKLQTFDSHISTQRGESSIRSIFFNHNTTHLWPPGHCHLVYTVTWLAFKFTYERKKGRGNEEAGDEDVLQWWQTHRCCCSSCVTSPAVHGRVTANLDNGEQELPQCPCSLCSGTCHVIYLFILLFFPSKFRFNF